MFSKKHIQQGQPSVTRTSSTLSVLSCVLGTKRGYAFGPTAAMDSQWISGHTLRPEIQNEGGGG
jgi:hypothetical protein